MAGNILDADITVPPFREFLDTLPPLERLRVLIERRGEAIGDVNIVDECLGVCHSQNVNISACVKALLKDPFEPIHLVTLTFLARSGFGKCILDMVVEYGEKCVAPQLRCLVSEVLRRSSREGWQRFLPPVVEETDESEKDLADGDLSADSFVGDTLRRMGGESNDSVSE